MELDISRGRKSFKNGVQFAWDATSISAYQKCPRYYQFRLIEGWRGRQENEHLRFGGHFATALEHYYKHVALGMPWEEALEEVVLEALIDTWDGEQPWQSTDSNKTRDTLIRSIIWYVDQFHDEPVQVVHRSDGTPMVEYSFALPVDNDIIFTGHLDRVVMLEDVQYVMDQKTTKTTITPRWFDQFKPNTQMSMYTFAGQVILGSPVKGVIIDGAQVAVGFTRFERATTFRTTEELNEWYDETLHWIERAQHDTHNMAFAANPQSCGNYGGCEFRNVCARPQGVRRNFLAADFTQDNPWDPLEAR